MVNVSKLTRTIRKVTTIWILSDTKFSKRHQKKRAQYKCAMKINSHSMTTISMTASQLQAEVNSILLHPKAAHHFSPAIGDFFPFYISKFSFMFFISSIEKTTNVNRCVKFMSKFNIFYIHISFI